MRRLARLAQRALAAALVFTALGCQAGIDSLRFCGGNTAPDAARQDRLLQFASIVERALGQTGAEVALVSRSGLNLQRFGLRYSHAGFALRDEAPGRWAVRQLYYACDERRSRLYDQGLAGFVMGNDDPAMGHVSIVWWPDQAPASVAGPAGPAEPAPLARTVFDKARALRLLAPDYSANAYPFSLRYQNCNQWVAEMLATAWAGLADGEPLRAQAQQWLRAQAYAPKPVPVASHWLMAAGGFVPWLRYDDHPEADRFALRFHTSLPTDIEAFVRAQQPQAQRVEICHAGAKVVIRRGWQPMGTVCEAGAGDEVLTLD